MTQLIAPPEITIQTLPYGWKGKQRLAVSLMLATPIDSHHPYSTQDAWNGIMQVIPKAEIFDLGYPKPRGEVLVYGNYYAPDGFAISADKILLQVGNLKKELIVTGERFWRKIMTPTTPEPFTQLPLTYEMGFGGETDERNPTGKGFPLENDTPMPQLEYPDQLLVKQNQKPTPAGLNATSVDWMPRKKLWGTYDTIWQEQESPFFARDLNPDFFMQAAPDQWFEGFIPEQTQIRLENMHSQNRVLEGLTPNYRLEFLAEKDGQQTLHKATTDTLILLPDINMQVLIARTEFEITSIDGGEVSALMAGYTSANKPENRDLKHYSDHLKLRLSSEITDEQILDYSPLRPTHIKEPLTSLSMQERSKPEIAYPGAATLAALAAAGGLAAKLAATSAKKEADDASAATDSATPSSDSSSSSAPSISQVHAEQAAGSLKTQLEAMGFTEQELDALMQAPPEQVPELINQMLAKLFPNHELADATNAESDPIVKQQLDRAGQLAEESSKSVPQSDNPSVNKAIVEALSSPNAKADFDAISPLVEQQLDRVNTELKYLYDVYPGDKSELDEPSDIGTKAILNLLKGLSGKS